MIISPSEALDMILEESKKVVAEEAIGLKASLVIASPVGAPETWKNQAGARWAVANGYVGGTFKGSWQIKKINDLHFQITNPLEYASVLFAGYRNVNGGIGSKQWMDGGDGLVQKTDNNITRRLNNIKH